MQAIQGRAMARKKVPKSVQVRIYEEVVSDAKLASNFAGESLTEYISRIVAERANQDIDRSVAERAKAKRKSN